MTHSLAFIINKNAFFCLLQMFRKATDLASAALTWNSASFRDFRISPGVGEMSYKCKGTAAC